jgi:hypothetical protein
MSQSKSAYFNKTRLKKLDQLMKWLKNKSLTYVLGLAIDNFHDLIERQNKRK